jgi:hypothetical protein
MDIHTKHVIQVMQQAQIYKPTTEINSKLQSNRKNQVV